MCFGGDHAGEWPAGPPVSRRLTYLSKFQSRRIVAMSVTAEVGSRDLSSDMLLEETA